MQLIVFITHTGTGNCDISVL